MEAFSINGVLRFGYNPLDETTHHLTADPFIRFADGYRSETMLQTYLYNYTFSYQTGDGPPIRPCETQDYSTNGGHQGTEH